MKWTSRCLIPLPALLVCFLGLALGGCDRHGEPGPARGADGMQPIMDVDEVRVGMHGYGLTVFHGTKIETFPVEVMSIERAHTAGRAVIWIRCPDARMQESGPVQGMSGSPIYLWEEGATGKPGDGGRLIGAFAWGFELSKNCYVGVQPIAYMREIAKRASVQKNEPPAESQAQARAPMGAEMIGQLLRQAKQQNLPGTLTWQAAAIERVLRGGETSGEREAQVQTNNAPPAPATFTAAPQAMYMPVNVGSARLAQVLTPLMTPVGLIPFGGPMGTMAGQPPKEYHIEDAVLQPGGVMAMPLVWGDLDLAAVGTVTDVLPDGTVLAYGHADPSLTQGVMRMPMATGYVHMIMPMLTASFKYSGSGRISGALIRNEQSGVCGSPKGTFTASPVNVSVSVPGQPERLYHYQIVDDKRLSPILAAISALRSVGAVQDPPMESTMHFTGTLKFQQGYELKIDKLIPGSDEMGVLLATLPPITAMATNSFSSVMLKSMEAKITVVDGLQSGNIVEGALDRAELEPGDTLKITVTIQPYNKTPVDHHIELTIPSDLPDGEYPLLITDAETYIQSIGATRPHLLTAASVPELHRALQRLMTTRDDALYVTLQLEQHGLAIGQQELPRLPSSRMAIIASPVSTLAKPYRDTVETVAPLDLVPRGAIRFLVKVNSHLEH